MVYYYCTSNTVLLKLGMGHYKELFGFVLQSPAVLKEQSWFSSYDFFSNLPYRQIQQLYQHSSTEFYAKGQLVYKEDDQSSNIYLIKSGVVALSKNFGSRCEDGGNSDTRPQPNLLQRLLSLTEKSA